MREFIAELWRDILSEIDTPFDALRIVLGSMLLLFCLTAVGFFLFQILVHIPLIAKMVLGFLALIAALLTAILYMAAKLEK